MSFKGIGVKYFAFFMALVALAGGIYLTFFHSKGFIKTQATIVSLDETWTADSEMTYRATVEFTVDGVKYTGVLDTQSPSYRVGKNISVFYDPDNPTVVHSGVFLGIYCIVAGTAVLLLIIGSEIRKRKSLADVQQKQAAHDMSYPQSAPGPERELYFLTDLGTAKAGHRIEDAGRKVLYEAKMTKFTLTAPFGFDFIDHEHGSTVPHLIGHEEISEWDTLLLDNHYTFTFDGRDIWKYLKENGISIQSSFTGAARIEYRILHNDTEIATAVGSSQNVHEEAECTGVKPSNLVPVRGFYRIMTTETDLSLLFVTLLAFARSGASDQHGGYYGTVFGTLKNLVNK